MRNAINVSYQPSEQPQHRFQLSHKASCVYGSYYVPLPRSPSSLWLLFLPAMSICHFLWSFGKLYKHPTRILWQFVGGFASDRQSSGCGRMGTRTGPALRKIKRKFETSAPKTYATHFCTQIGQIIVQNRSGNLLASGANSSHHTTTTQLYT